MASERLNLQTAVAPDGRRAALTFLCRKSTYGLSPHLPLGVSAGLESFLDQ